MKEKEQSSIDYLISAMEYHGKNLPKPILKQAKELHKKEIMEAFYNAKSESGLSATDSEIYYNNAEQYYTEKYGE